MESGCGYYGFYDTTVVTMSEPFHVSYGDTEMTVVFYGHAAGDDAIRTVAGILRKHFNNNCRCYRLGGDEFAVLSEYIGPDEFEVKRQKFLAEVEEVNMTKDYPLVVATGYHLIWADTVNEGFSQADMAMYENKKYLKSLEQESDKSSNG